MKKRVLIGTILLITTMISVLIGNSIATYLGQSDTALDKIKNGDYNIGDTLKESYNELINRDDLYCVNYEKQLSGNYTNYTIDSHISIKGNTATNEDGDEWTSIENGKLAYILHQGGGYGTSSNYTRAQKAVYGTINTWYDEVGTYLGVTDSVKFQFNGRVTDSNLVSDAEEYAENLSTDTVSDYITDKTDKSAIEITGYSKDDEEYLRVGPFSWEFSGKLTKVRVYGDEGDEISNVKYSRFVGDEEKFYSDPKNIKTGDYFYITIKANSGFTKIGKITAKHRSTNSNTEYTAELWFLHSSSDKQELMLVDTGENETTPEAIETPFTYDIQLTKNLKIVKTDSIKLDKKLENVGFILKNKENGKYIKKEENGYSLVGNKDNATEFKTNSEGELTINNLPMAVYIAYETSNPNKGYEIKEEETQIGLTKKNVTITNDYKLGEISIEKLDKDHNEIKLANVEFTLKCKEGKYAGKYVGIDSEGSAIYLDTETIIKTDSQGKLNIKDVWIGKYTLTEIKNPNYGYIIDPASKNIDLDVVAHQTTEKQIKNEQVYIRLSGFIWQDINADKTTIRNDYYKLDGKPDDYVDDMDTAFDGITVRLKKINDNSIVYEGYSDRKEFTDKAQETVSGEKGLYSEIDGGEYVFEYVRIEELSNYYVEFEYDGLIYQSVVPHLDNNNGSKADDKTERAILDRNFAMINATGENKIDVNNGANNAYSITYNDTVDHKTSIKDSSQCTLHATTSDANCNIKNYFKPGQTEIRYINLGLYEKPQADLALGLDLENVNVGVNGYWHIYKYGARQIDQSASETWNVGVKFKNSSGYKRAIYKTDKEYTSEDKSKELQVYLTYKIALKNESTYFEKVNYVSEYFDNNYELVGIGTGLDSNNNITGNLNYTNPSQFNAKYNRTIITADSLVAPAESNYIYIQFKLNKDSVISIMNNGETLYTRAEITSYTIYKDQSESTVAAVDIDSVPGNTNIDNIDTYEDDTDSAPPVQLELTDARKIQGTIFVDNSQVNTDGTRSGNGIFDEGEMTLSGVKVTLHELNNSIEDKIVETTEGGNFEFSEFIPGKYQITYTWGDKTYTVQNYKGTNYDSSRNQNDMYWYKDAVDTRKTDAIDDYTLRQKIDEQMASITDRSISQKIAEAYQEGYTGEIINKMNSMTPVMEFSVEYDTVVTDGTADKVEFIVRNVDFGIVERARQQLDMSKRVSAYKITLANGQELVNAIITEDGRLEGITNNTTKMPATVLSNGYVKTEVDNEILEGSRLEVTYEIKVINNSEKDYNSEKYYKYGIIEGNVVTLTPAAVVDYLDMNLAYDPNDNPDWTVITASELKDLNTSKVDDTEYLNSKRVLYTEKTKQALEPGQEVSVNLTASKLLTSAQELNFKNTVETAKIEKVPNGGGSVVQYFPTANSEDIMIIPSTGDNREIVIPIVVTVLSLAVLGIGAFSIKKFIIDKK